MAILRSTVPLVKKEEMKNSSDAQSKVRRRSFSGLEDSLKQEQKTGPKSVGDIDTLIQFVANITISKEDDKTIDAAAPKNVLIKENATTEDKTTQSKSTKKSTKEINVVPKTVDNDDVLESTKSPNVEDVTASYVSSMKEILSSFDKTLQLGDSSSSDKKFVLTKEAPISVKKEVALPLPRFLITSAAANADNQLPRNLASRKRMTMPIIKKETSESVQSPSSVVPAVGDRESKDEEEKDIKDVKAVKEDKDKLKERERFPSRRGRSRTNPVEEGDIARSSKQPQARRRYVPQDTAPYNVNYAAANNYTADAIIDNLLNGHQSFPSHRQSLSQMDFYGFPDLSASFNLGLDNTAVSPDAGLYNSFTAASTPDLLDSNEIEGGLGVYSSPVAPLTPPSTNNISFNQNPISTPPYGSPQANLLYAAGSLPMRQNWSAQNSTVGSPQTVVSTHPAVPTGLNPDAIMEMKRLILLPLSQDPSLLQFTPLIAAASMRLDEGRILCLRDLEKYLLFKSQEMSPSPQTYINFCEKFLYRCKTAIAPLEAVRGDLTRIQDTPYYEGYFMDVLAHQKEALVSQLVSASTAAVPQPQMTILQRPVSTVQGISLPKAMAPQAGIRKQSVMHRQQPSMSEKLQEQLLAALQQQANIQELANLGNLFDLTPRDMPISPVSQNQDLLNGSDDNQSDDNGSRLNPALLGRKKKVALKPQGGHVCLHRDDETGAICGKKYNRPCDLKKHGKTHSRPHKCSEPTCLYHEKGFPTEKERDRHETDRHSDAPQMWYCEFPPCPYKSKRESNCKQHMEKQHDYVYERSKHNPRNPNGNADAFKRPMPADQIAPRKDSTGVAGVAKQGVTSIFDHGISTPPNDAVNGFFPSFDEATEMASIQNMYLLTPSPENTQTFGRSGSVDSTADIKQQGDLSGVFTGDWTQFNQWQPMPAANGQWIQNGLIVE